MNGSPHARQTEYDSGRYQFLALPVYRSGEIAQETGIFTVLHPKEKESSEVLIMRGTRLPFCPACHHPLAFCLEQEAAHISEDADFGARKTPVSTLPKRRRRKKKTNNANVRLTIWE